MCYINTCSGKRLVRKRRGCFPNNIYLSIRIRWIVLRLSAAGPSAIIAVRYRRVVTAYWKTLGVFFFKKHDRICPIHGLNNFQMSRAKTESKTDNIPFNYYNKTSTSGQFLYKLSVYINCMYIQLLYTI